MRSPARAGGRFHRPVDRRALRPDRGRGRAERPVGGVVLPPQESAGEHPHPRQPRRLRRHAKRNEFTIGERRIIGYGGSQSFQSPNSFFGPAAKDCWPSSMSTSSGLKPRLTAIFTHRSVSRAACSFRARRSGVTPGYGRCSPYECGRDHAPAQQRQAARGVCG